MYKAAFKHLSLIFAILISLTSKGYTMSQTQQPQTEANPEITEVVGDVSMILLSCPADIPDADALCAALEAALKERAPNVEVERSGRAPSDGELLISLRITSVTPQFLEGHLEWSTSSIATQSGPPLGLGADDTTIKPHMFGSFTAGLVRLSKLPIY